MHDRQKALPITKVFVHTDKGVYPPTNRTNEIAGKTLVVICGGRKSTRRQKYSNIVEVFDEETGMQYEVNIGENGNAVLTEDSSIKNIYFKEPIFVSQSIRRMHKR